MQASFLTKMPSRQCAVICHLMRTNLAALPSTLTLVSIWWLRLNGLLGQFSKSCHYTRKIYPDDVFKGKLLLLFRTQQVYWCDWSRYCSLVCPPILHVSFTDCCWTFIFVVTHPCNPHPCGSGKVCDINRQCYAAHLDVCESHKCLTGKII